MALLGGIIVAVVGADDDVILAGVSREIGDVFVGFAGDVESVLMEKIRAGGVFPPVA